MTTAYNGRIFNAVMDEGKPFEIVWDDQVYDFEPLRDPQGRAEQGRRAWSSSSSRPTPSGSPTRRAGSATARRASPPAPLVGMFKDGKTEMAPHLPTSPDNLAERAAIDFEFWADHDIELNERFNAWLAAADAGRGGGRDPPPPADREDPRMADMPADGTAAGLRTADGAPLKAALARAQRRAPGGAPSCSCCRCSPSCSITFVMPIGQMLLPLGRTTRPSPTTCRRSSPGSRANPAGTEPDEAAFAALAADLAAAAEARTIGRVGTRINYEIPGTRSLFTSGRRARADDLEPPFREAMLELDDDWGDPELWTAMRDASAALHRELLPRRRSTASVDPDGSIVRVAPERSASTCRCSGAPCPALGGDHRALPAPRLPDRASAGDAAAALLEPPDDPGAAAVLDLAPGAHHRLDGAAAEPGRAQQRAGRARHHRRRRPRRADVQPASAPSSR